MDNVITARSSTPPPILLLSTPVPSLSTHLLNSYFIFFITLFNTTLSLTLSLLVYPSPFPTLFQLFPCLHQVLKKEGTEGKKEQCHGAVKMIEPVEAKEKQSSTDK